MRTRIMLAALMAATASPALPQQPQATPAPTPAAPVEEVVKVALDTSAGRIVIALDKGRAPLTTANFLKYVAGAKYNGESIYRAMKYSDTGGLVQGGITSDARKLLPAVAHESTAATGLKHVRGAISMASQGPGTAQADFFILTTDIPGLDSSGADQGFAVFGKVVEGMEVVDRILASPVSPTKGEGSMKGEMLEPAVKIVKATKVD